MNRTSLRQLMVATVVAAVCGWLLFRTWYGSLSGWSPWAALPWAVLVVVLAWHGRRVRRALAEGTIGMDRSQVSPLAVFWTVVWAKAAAWTGAVLAGLLSGIAVWLVPRMSFLAAARENMPGVVTLLVVAVAMAVVGVWVERSCEVPPGDDDATEASHGEDGTPGKRVSPVS